MRSSQIFGTIPPELGRLSMLGKPLGDVRQHSKCILTREQTNKLNPIGIAETLLLEGNWLSGTIPSSLGNLFKARKLPH